ncbi:MAG: glycerol-3-phosphate dehydrogenase/oxidase [Pirellulales bacterium]
MSHQPPNVLILGAGINGCALARELVLNGVGVTLVDTADVASGATAYSSRLIHGGLRYLEYGEFSLVRESLAERTRLLKLAPQFVRPLQLFIPVENRFGGVLASAARFLGLEGWLHRDPPHQPRGQWLVRAGLWFYDTYARDPSLPRRTSHRLGEESTPPVNDSKYIALCSYFDAQVRYPERFTLALVEDARALAAENGAPFELLCYHEARLDGRRATIEPVGNGSAGASRTLEPAAIINATGAWVDLTLRQLHVESATLMGGTKGSHFITHRQGLVHALAGRGIYAEAPDGRPVFVLPLGDAVLVGTTDEPYQGDPADAVCSPRELGYLLDTVNEIFPQFAMTEADVELEYSGVRPLPASGDASPASITRRHWMEEHHGAALPIYSIIGGKLTTCRSLAESSAATILARLGLPVRATSRERPVPGGDVDADGARRAQIAERFALPRDTVERLWALCGARVEAIFDELERGDDADWRTSLSGTWLPRGFARWIVEHEWVSRLDDLVERRLMLLYEPQLTEACLRELAGQLVAAGKLPPERLDEEVNRTMARLAEHFDKQVLAQAATT